MIELVASFCIFLSLPLTQPKQLDESNFVKLISYCISTLDIRNILYSFFFQSQIKLFLTLKI